MKIAPKNSRAIAQLFNIGIQSVLSAQAADVEASAVCRNVAVIVANVSIVITAGRMTGCQRVSDYIIYIK